MRKATTASRDGKSKLGHHPPISVLSSDTTHHSAAPALDPRRALEGRELNPGFRILKYQRSDNHRDVFLGARTRTGTRLTTQMRTTDCESTPSSYEAKAV
ncbi:hypothetical protein G647_01419 [Cladophialophora carrionii CBS 160.54]|uniref:Uncharacterized protein n=1 Tax=Cladophialophora carrionii CBS 160.54 TaxID=1279043 RepID=V9DSN1_9EURO|nr:uncharacterized protein G647_01419 [Cladophialophora carrionii CBS 160.54]ETI28967.1 hypothetical protein G647_01419 [Cladophialophora carrionii CBS 160.54]